MGAELSTGSAESWPEVLNIPGDTAHFRWQTDGDGERNVGKRWGFAALVVAATSPPKPPLSQEKADALIEGWSVATTRAHGAVVDAVQVSRDEWDEERLR